MRVKSNIKFAGGEKSIRNINPATYDGTSFYSFLAGAGYGDIRALETIRWYKRCMPFFRAVEMRAEAFSSIPIKVREKTTKKYVDSHPILELLGDAGKPNPQESIIDFKKAYSTWRDMTGESFLVATGFKGSEPLTVSNAKVQDMTIGTTNSRISGMFEVPGTYSWNTTYFTEKFFIDPVVFGGSFRWWNRDDDKEIWQSGDFNPTAGSANFRGLSKASPISYEIQQYIEGNVNNLSVLSRGARPSVAWVSQLDEPMTDDQYKRWKEQVMSYEGAVNAGKQVLVDAVEPKVISTTNKDMEFSELKKSVRTDIFVQYAIPLALVSPEQMTLDNLKTSSIQLFDLSVLPHTDNLLDQMTQFLMPRYPNSENLELSYNPLDIEPLKERAINQTSELGKMMILTDNELRTRIGYEEVEGGNSVWKSTATAPAESDVFTTDNLQVPRTGNKESVYQDFVKHMQGQTLANGDRAFTDIEIDVYAKDYGLIDEIGQFRETP